MELSAEVYVEIVPDCVEYLSLHHFTGRVAHLPGYESHRSIQTCAKVPKRFEILGSLSPRSGSQTLDSANPDSGTLMDLGPCASFLPWDSGNPGPQDFDMQ